MLEDGLVEERGVGLAPQTAVVIEPLVSYQHIGIDARKFLSRNEPSLPAAPRQDRYHGQHEYGCGSKPSFHGYLSTAENSRLKVSISLPIVFSTS